MESLHETKDRGNRHGAHERKLRYPVGSDVAVWLEKKSTMSDEQFQEYMMTSLGSLAPHQR
jgi:hypothetical protein